MSLAHDEKTLERRQADAKRAALRLNLISERPHGVKEPALNKLCQYAAQRERRRARRICYNLIRSRRLKGGKLYFVTISRPEWTVLEEALEPKLVHTVREWTSRRARNLTRFGRHRLIGFVDVAWNERSDVQGTSHWSAHVHMLVLVRFADQYAARPVLRHVFDCEGDGDRVLKPILIKAAHTPPFAIDYCSRALLLNLPRLRRTYRTYAGQNTQDQSLPRVLQWRVEELYAELGPKPFWILSGIRRYGDTFVPLNSKVEPRRYDKFLTRQRPANRPSAPCNT